ncbi:hypothetical protein DAEQUDRAFT_705260 [Daedalea quercina L-15889]|uniref:Uncharacterized protein n=1 Tax=Daedalea quercina L-15889 TaxID=1314783 RepID=A0A165SZD1_9APHY|nr:hypothetical protein DAEQUDRAFT_705260 [Daedalea quercina L-15889]
MQFHTLRHVTRCRHQEIPWKRVHLRHNSSSTRPDSIGHDSCGIPTHPTWSVNELLSSYPQPSMSPSTLKRLHELSALIAPSDGTPEHENLTREMEGLVRLVEAVKLVDTRGLQSASDASIPDGRIWAEGQGIELEQCGTSEHHGTEVNGRALLRYSTRVRDGLYIVDADKRR